MLTKKISYKQKPISQVEKNWKSQIVFPNSKLYPKTALQINNQELGDYLFNPYNKTSLIKEYLAWSDQVKSTQKTGRTAL